VRRCAVSAVVAAENPNSKNLLEQHASFLREGLAGQGLSLDSLRVHVESQQTGQHWSRCPQPPTPFEAMPDNCLRTPTVLPSYWLERTQIDFFA